MLRAALVVVVVDVLALVPKDYDSPEPTLLAPWKIANAPYPHA